MNFIPSTNFASLGVSLKRQLEVLVAGLSIAIIVLGGPLGILTMIYLLVYTAYWPVAFLYLVWAWIIDADCSETGGRHINWIRRSIWWKYFKNYFPIALYRLSSVELDPKRNYLFCCFPHGILPVGAISVFATDLGDFQRYFPKHTPHMITLKLNFRFPIIRELLLALGMCSASKKSISSILGNPDGGHVAALIVGGAEEAFNCHPRQYNIVLKKRKGFVKLALQHGSPLVPVLSFGETDVYDQVNNPKGSRLRKFQDWVKRITGIPPVIPLGRGYLQYSYGFVPLRKPVNVLVGQPIEVERLLCPTQEEIDHYHAIFINQLENMFEEEKFKYLPNAKDVKLIVD